MKRHRSAVRYDETARVLRMDERIRQVYRTATGVRHLRLVSEKDGDLINTEQNRKSIGRDKGDVKATNHQLANESWHKKAVCQLRYDLSRRTVKF